MILGRLIASAIPIFLCAAPWELTAAAPNSTFVYGRVFDPSGAAIPDADVTVVSEDTGFRRATLSQIDGGYAVGALANGSYKITVRKDGFSVMVRFRVKVEGGQPARADFTLAVGAVEETITVEGTAPLLSQAETPIGTRVEQEQIARLPLNGRGVLALLDLTPGTNTVPATRGEAGQFTLDGQRPNTNAFSVDGIAANVGVSAGAAPAQVTGGALPAVSAFGSLDLLLPLEAVSELRVATAETAPDAARLPGAIVAMTSRSGSNEFHGSVAYRFRHEWMSANDWFASSFGQRRPAFRMQDVAPTLGGPVRRNRTFFFLAYERMALRGPYVWRQAVPSQEARLAAPDWMQPALNLFPAPDGPDTGNGTATWNGIVVRPSGLQSGVLRLDHALTSRTTLFGRYSDADSSNEFGSAQVNLLDLRFRSMTAGVNWRPSARVAADLRLNESEAGLDSVWSAAGAAPSADCGLQGLALRFLGSVAGCDYVARLLIGGVGQVTGGDEGLRRQRQFESTASSVLTLGMHSIRGGVDYRRLTFVRRDAGGTVSLIADNVGETVDPRNQWRAESAALRASMSASEFAAWVQDSWQAQPRLTLTASLRWQMAPAPAPSGTAYFFDPQSGLVIDSHSPVWRNRAGSLAPRLGVAYRLDREGRTVLRAGAGVAFDSSLSIATDLINSGPLGNTDYTSSLNAPFSSRLRYGFMPDLRSPRIDQWTVSLDRAFSSSDLVSVRYVGAQGGRLIRRELGGPGSNPSDLVALTTNHGASDYRGLEAQYRRRMRAGFEAQVSYAWSHSIDDDSSDASLMWAGAGTSAAGDRGSSDFDLRHSLTTAFTYEFPARASGVAHALRGWAVDGMARARTGFPISALVSEQYIGIPLANAFRPYLLTSRPVWISDPAAPGGRELNPDAFLVPTAETQGSLGRNAISGFGMVQFDLALRREFRLAERRSLQFRLDAFNALNHPNFADPVRFLNSPQFGRSASMLNLMLGSGSPASGLSPLLQTGGARSIQVAVRLKF